MLVLMILYFFATKAFVVATNSVNLSSNGLLMQKFTDLEDRTHSLETENRTLKSLTLSLENDNKKIKNEIRMLKTQKCNEISNNETLEKLERRVAEPSPGTNGVAFFATMTSVLQAPPHGHVFIFNSVKTNIGHGYNGLTGAFTCPESGIYAFFWNIRVNSHRGKAELVRNGVVVTGSATGNSAYDNSGSFSAIIFLTLGDTVTLNVENPAGVNFITPSSFGGYKLF